MTNVDLEIARKATPQPILEIGERLGIPSQSLKPFGHDKARLILAGSKSNPPAKTESLFWSQPLTRHPQVRGKPRHQSVLVMVLIKLVKTPSFACVSRHLAHVSG